MGKAMRPTEGPNSNYDGEMLKPKVGTIYDT